MCRSDTPFFSVLVSFFAGKLPTRKRVPGRRRGRRPAELIYPSFQFQGIQKYKQGALYRQQVAAPTREPPQPTAETPY